MKLSRKIYIYNLAMLLISLVLFKVIIDKSSKHKDGIAPLRQGNILINFFKISDCISNCNENGKLTKLLIINDTFYLDFSHWLNCAGVKEVNANLLNDTLFIETRGGVFEEKIDGDTLRIYRVADCNCYYNLRFKLIGLTKLPKSIRINNEKIENYLGPLL